MSAQGPREELHRDQQTRGQRSQPRRQPRQPQVQPHAHGQRNQTRQARDRQIRDLDQSRDSQQSQPRGQEETQRLSRRRGQSRSWGQSQGKRGISGARLQGREHQDSDLDAEESDHSDQSRCATIRDPHILSPGMEDKEDDDQSDQNQSTCRAREPRTVLQRGRGTDEADGRVPVNSTPYVRPRVETERRTIICCDTCNVRQFPELVHTIIHFRAVATTSTQSHFMSIQTEAICVLVIAFRIVQNGVSCLLSSLVIMH